MMDIPPLCFLNVVSFVAGGHRFAVEAAQVRAQLPAGQLDGTLAVEHILGLPENEIYNPLFRCILLIKGQPKDYAVTVADPVELSSLAIHAIYPLPSLIAARNTLPGIRGLAMESDGVTVLVDFLARE